MFTKRFWLESSERAIKTLAQTFLSLTAADTVFNVFASDWQTIVGVSLGAALLSYATSIVSSNIGPRKDSPSLVD